MTPEAGAGFSARLVAWHARHGRHDLPWQQERTPYRVWLSEIMLQQTQVAAVIPYFERFVAAFPEVHALAAASLDEVLHLWSGLGYYSRARNLHRSATLIVERHAGCFPTALEDLTALPGIGRSTAGAILALAHGRRCAILDGNVKRVLARYHAVPGWPGMAAVQKTLWQLAERHLPESDLREYTQALMDLGATVCTRTRPRCSLCPLAPDCQAHRDGRPADFPGARPRRVLPRRQTCFLIIENEAGAVLLERRPAAGVWGGLWCFPEMADETELPRRAAALGLRDAAVRARLPVVAHTFTHFHLDITPLHIATTVVPPAVREQNGLRWHSPADSTRIGLSAPVTRLLHALRQAHIREAPMSRTVHCIKLDQEAEGLNKPPYPGTLGERIFEHVSKQAWQMWLQHQTMLINEYRLSPIEPRDRKFLETEMEKYFFGEGSEKPKEFVDPNA